MSRITLKASQVWGLVRRSLRYPIFDSIYPNTTATTSATANTFGAWVQISADIGTNKKLYYVVVGTLNATSSDRSIEFEIGEGAGGSEVAVARGGLLIAAVNAVSMGYMPIVVSIHVNLTNNARLSVRAKNSVAAANTYSFHLDIGAP